MSPRDGQTGCENRELRWSGVRAEMIRPNQMCIRDSLEVEIRKLLHEVSRAAEHALGNAKKIREEGASAVETARERFSRLEREIVTLTDVDAKVPRP